VDEFGLVGKGDWRTISKASEAGAVWHARAGIVTAAVGQVQAVSRVSALLPHSRVHETTAHLHGISAKPSQSTLTAQQAEIQFKMKFVKKITNSANHGRNQLFVRFGASRAGSLGRFQSTYLAHLA
jgi:7-cyano-7-deazaguanine synthase in queuosine biosynthesis